MMVQAPKPMVQAPKPMVQNARQALTARNVDLMRARTGVSQQVRKVPKPDVFVESLENGFKRNFPDSERARAVSFPPPKNEEIFKKRQMENLLKDDMASITGFLDERNLTDVSIVDSGEIIVKRFGIGREFTGIVLPDYIVDRIIKSCASINGKTLDTFTSFPKFEGTIPKYDARITGFLPPAVVRPSIQIRKPPLDIFSLEDYVKKGFIKKEFYEKVVNAIGLRKNIIVCGGTGSGKTTFTNAVILKMQEFTPKDNFYIVEDSSELQCTARMKTKICVPKDAVRDAVIESMRFSPDRIIFGEVRTKEVMYELLDAWKTGADGGVTTMHTNDCRTAIMRIRSMMAGMGDMESADNLSEMVQFLVHMRHTDRGVLVDEVMEVTPETDRMFREETKGFPH